MTEPTDVPIADIETDHNALPPAKPAHLAAILLLWTVLYAAPVLYANRVDFYFWTTRLSAALCILPLLILLYDFARRIFSSPRAGLYAALVFGTCFGSSLSSGDFATELGLSLWTTAALYYFYLSMQQAAPTRWLSYGFAVSCAIGLLTAGLPGIIFPVGAALLYLTITRSLARLRRMHLLWSAILFLSVTLSGLRIAGSWSVAGSINLPTPNSLPVWAFLLLAIIQLLPWTLFLIPTVRSMPMKDMLRRPLHDAGAYGLNDTRLFLLGWAAFILFFYCFFDRQMQSSLPALPAFALLIAGWLNDESIAANQSPIRITGRRIALALLILGILCVGTYASLLVVKTFSHEFDARITYDLTSGILIIAIFFGVLANWLYRRANRPNAGNVALAIMGTACFIFIKLIWVGMMIDPPSAARYIIQLTK